MGRVAADASWVVDDNGIVIGQRLADGSVVAPNVIRNYTAAQLSALAAAGGLTTNAAYVASGKRYDAASSTTLLLRPSRLDMAAGLSDSLVVKRFSDSVGVGTANSGTAATHSIDSNGPWGRPAYKIVLTAGNTYTEVQLSSLSLAAFAGHVAFRIWIQDYTLVAQVSLYAGTTGYSRYYQHTHGVSNDSTNRFNGEHLVIAGPTRAGAVNTFVGGTDTLDAAKLRISNIAGSGGTIWIDECIVPAVGRPTHILTHDDNSVSWIDLAAPVLAANGLRATFSFASSLTGTNPALFLDSSGILELSNAGHQICSHNVNNYPFDDGLVVDVNKQIASVYSADFVTSARAMAAIVGVGADTSFHPWVQGRHGQTAFDALYAAGVRMARGTDSSAGYNFPQIGLGNGVMALKIKSLHTMSQTDILTAVNNAETYGLTVVWMIHQITQGAPVGVETSLANYEYLCELISGKVSDGLAVCKTAGEFVREVYSERLVPSALMRS